jgi:DHA2 family methylenomycin A resistance protein-like MFS transporter
MLAPPSGASPALTLTAKSLGFAAVQLDVTIVNVALKTIGSSLGGDIAGLQRVVNAHTVVFASLILTPGALGDRLAPRGCSLAVSSFSSWPRWRAARRRACSY